MIKLSIGTAIELGYKKGKNSIFPTTGYLLIGENCNNACQFCAQSITSQTSKKMLSRISWCEIEEETLVELFKNYKKNNIKRICMQVISNKNSLIDAKNIFKRLKEELDIKISISAKLEQDEIDEFVALGVDKIGIAIDAVSADLYRKIKGGNYEEKINFICKNAKKYQGKISTHIIAGLGETQRDIFDLYLRLFKQNITCSLFAFTPIKGTKLEFKEPPDLKYYRQVQIMIYLIRSNLDEKYFEFDSNNNFIGLKDFQFKNDELRKEILQGIPFEVSGCKNCNRPYYNERPGGKIYNYSRSLQEDEVIKAIEECELNLEIGI